MIQCGVVMFPTDKSITPIELARAVETRGLDFLMFPEHTHIPVESKSPFFPDGKLPEPYLRSHDPFVALAACAAVTERIKLATGICLVPQHSPITLAKTIASLDRLSNGRFIFGIGAGWNAPEMENHGTPYTRRWQVLRERVLAMKTIWREAQPEYHGEFVNFDPMWSYPKPQQAGGPKIWIGSNSKYAVDRVAEYADGWMPVMGRAGGASIQDLKEACNRRGRAFAELQLGLFYAPAVETELRGRIAEGFTQLIFGLPSETRETVLPKLDELAALAENLRR